MQKNKPKLPGKEPALTFSASKACWCLSIQMGLATPKEIQCGYFFFKKRKTRQMAKMGYVHKTISSFKCGLQGHIIGLVCQCPIIASTPMRIHLCTQNCSYHLSKSARLTEHHVEASKHSVIGRCAVYN